MKSKPIPQNYFSQNFLQEHFDFLHSPPNFLSLNFTTMKTGEFLVKIK